MAMSLLYALLGVHDIEQLPQQGYTDQELPNLSNEERKDRERVLIYKGLGNKEKKEVKQALYTALYHIVEYSYINPDVNMAIGKALCNAMSENPQENLKDHPGILRLRKVLNPIVADTIDEIETSSPKLAS